MLIKSKKGLSLRKKVNLEVAVEGAAVEAETETSQTGLSVGAS